MKARPHRYSEAEMEWLASQSLDLTYPELTALFNKEFGTRLSESALSTKCAKLGLKRPRYEFFTDEQIEWVKEQGTEITYSELAKRFNEKFGTNVKRYAMSDLCTKRLRLKRTVNKGQYKDGERGALKYKVGDEVVRSGYIWVKISDEAFSSLEKDNYNSLYRQNWKRKSDLVWEKENGPIPGGSFLIFLDGDTMNCELDNLYLVSKQVHARMCQNHWYNGNRQFVLTALRWCEMFVYLKECRKSHKNYTSYNEEEVQTNEDNRT